MEIKQNRKDLEYLAKVERTRELCNLFFPEYQRVENPELQDYWEAFKEEGKIVMTISYTNKNMLLKDKKIDEKKLFEFGKKYEKIWNINNFEILRD
ncbi:hypothetical protein GW932_05170 [archaeon]|nr:hypothetical protein [archaeon]